MGPLQSCPLASWVYQFRAGSLYQGLQLTALGLLSYRRLEGQDAVKIRSFDVGVGSITRGLEFHWGIFRLEREQALGIFVGAESIKRGGDKATTATLSIKLPIHPGNLSRRSVFDSPIRINPQKDDSTKKPPIVLPDNLGQQI